MKIYDGEIYTGMKLIYDGEPIEWVNRKGKVVEVMRKGKYVVSSVTDKYVFLKSDRKNASVEHKIYKNDIEHRIGVLEFPDLTTSIGLMFLHNNWYINDENLIKEAKKYNKPI